MSLTVRIMAPLDRDAQLIVSALRTHGLRAEIVSDTPTLGNHGDPIGPLVIAQESLTASVMQGLQQLLQGQPSWSDLPILVLTAFGQEARPEAFSQIFAGLGTPVLLERPLRMVTLVSSVQAAVRARERQYQIREALEQRDRASAALHAERETLRVMLDNLPVGVLLCDAEGAITRLNPAVERIFRHPAPETPNVAAHAQWISFHADGRRVRSEEYPLIRAIQTGQVIAAEQLCYQRGDGTRAWVSLSAAPIRNQAGEVSGGVVAVVDVDDAKRALDTLRTSEERFRRLVETSSVGILIGGLDGTITYINPSLLHTLGYSREEFEAGHVRWDKLTPPEYAEADAKAVEQLSKTGVAEPYVKAYLARDGRPVPLLVGAAVIASENRESEIAVFLTDLTTQKQAEAALIQIEKLAAVGRLAASISHEINNPLEAVTNLLYLIRVSGELPETSITYMSLAERELARVSQIVGQTLRFHRQSTRPRTLTTKELLEPVLGLYGGRLTNSHVEVSFEHRGSGTVTCYEGDVRQVLNNLVGNAIDAMRGGGRLRLRTADALLRSGAKPDAPPIEGVRITVADTGSGMSAETRRHIFDAFYTTKGINGTGLGLWISKGIVEKHGGRLDVRSSDREGHSGTVFSLFLPRDLAIEPAVSSPSTTFPMTA